MEFLLNADGSRTPIPDAIVAASDRRDLVAEYVAASPADREHLHELAMEIVLGKTAPKVDASPAPVTASSDAAAPGASAPVQG